MQWSMDTKDKHKEYSAKLSRKRARAKDDTRRYGKFFRT